MSHDYKIEIYSQNNCAGCRQAKQILTDRKMLFKEFLIDVNTEHKQELFNRLPNCRTVPQIFIAGKHIGGLEELVKELHSNDYS
jgi:glutaredoxin 3